MTEIRAMSEIRTFTVPQTIQSTLHLEPPAALSRCIYPGEEWPINPVGLKFFHQPLLWHFVKSFCEVQVHHVHAQL
jgi:hypothetical protein